MSDTQGIWIDGQLSSEVLLQQAAGWQEAHLDTVRTFLTQWFNEEEHITVKTSGSTGTPKSIQLSKDRMRASAKMTGEYFGLQAGDQALLCMPADYIAGKMMIVRSLELGLRLLVVAPSSLPMKGVEEQFAFAAMVPMQVHSTLETENGFEQLDQIRQLIIGGGAVNEALNKKLIRLQCSCFATYGMTETITHIAVKRLNGPERSPLFSTLPGVKIRPDERGCLVIEAPHLASGPVITNDLIEMEDFHLFRWLGRFDNVVNSGGVKLHPESLEEKLDEVMERRYFFAGLPDKRLGERLVLVIEGEPFQPSIRSLFDSTLTDYLDKYEQPSELLFCDAFVETETGKVRRAATLEKARS